VSGVVCAFMKVLHTISGMSLKSGGPSLSALVLVSGLRDAGVEAEIVTYASGDGGDAPIATDDFIHFLPPPKSARYGYSEDLNKFFVANRQVDLYHAHGLWQYSSHGTAAWARRSKKPYVISPRGMLYPEGLRKSSLFKRIAMLLYQRADLLGASCIHATCEQEYRYIRECGVRKPPIAIIPNAIDISGIQSKERDDYGTRRLGFVGRFAPIKNLEALLKAWAMSDAVNTGWELVLVGDCEPDYRLALEELAFRKLGLSNVKFCGFLSGQAKEDVLQSLDCLVLPSKSENFGMVVPEALVRGIPVIASKGTPWRDLEGSTVSGRCGWWVDNDIESMSLAIKQLMDLDISELIEMGRNGIKLVEGNFSSDATAVEMKHTYEWLQRADSIPDYVRFE